MYDYISRKAAIDAVNHALDRETILFSFVRKVAISALKKMPSADVVPTESQEIGYDQCANAMLKMWIDNVVTDGEYNRIMDRLNKLYFSGDEKKE